MKQQLFIITYCIFTVSTIGNAAPVIKGSLSEENYQIIASDKKSNSVSSRAQNFKLKTNFKKGTLALTDSNGNVAGPVVLAVKNRAGKVFTFEQALNDGICEKNGSKAITGFKINKRTTRRGREVQKLNLGTVTVNSDSGFAYTSRKPRKQDLLGSASAEVDSNCVPQGAGGKLGLASINQSSAKVDSIQINADTDSDRLADENDPDDDNDGIADAFDLDSNGDGVLDFYQTDAVGNFVGDDEDDDLDDDLDDDDGPVDDDDGNDIDDDPNFAFWFTNMQVDLPETLNLHIGNFSQDEIDEFVESNLNMAMKVPRAGERPVEIDCTGLTYCTLGGTGTIANYGGDNSGAPFPADFDEDGNGFGRIDGPASDNPIGDFFLKPNVGTSGIQPGNVIVQVIELANRVVKRPLMLNFLFNTTPAIKTLKLGQNNIATKTITYPVAPGGEGTDGNCFVHDISNGQNVVFTVHRPQRPGIIAAGESEYMDMGNLRIVVSTNHEGGNHSYCPAEAFSTSDPDLTLFTGYPGDTDPNQELGLLDTKGDTAFDGDVENTFTFSLDLEACTGATTGTTVLDLKLRTPRNDNAGQRFCIERTN